MERIDLPRALGKDSIVLGDLPIVGVQENLVAAHVRPQPAADVRSRHRVPIVIHSGGLIGIPLTRTGLKFSKGRSGRARKEARSASKRSSTVRESSRPPIG